MLPPSSFLPENDRRALLELARQAIVEAVCHDRLPAIPEPSGALAQLAGAFVTLHRRGSLRGCIGQVGALERLADTVVRCAISAAQKDPRFRPVVPEELADLEIEISILSPLESILPEAFEVGLHGVMIVREGRRGVLLPQVAVEHGWARERFLEEACGKAGLEPGAWKDPETRLMAFTAEVFSEADFRSPHPAHARS